MGIFDDAARKIAEEDEKRAEKETRQAEARRKALRNFKSELSKFLARNYGFADASFNQTDEALGLTVGDRTLAISCASPEKFAIADTSDETTSRSGLTLEQAAEEVVRWLKSLSGR